MPKETKKSKKSTKNDEVKELIAELWDEVVELQKDLNHLAEYITEMNKQIKVIATRQGVPYEL